jgi:hypothetical protein
MPLSKQANNVMWPINDHGKEVRDISTQHAHIERFQLRNSRLAPAENSETTTVARKANLCFDLNGINSSSYAANLIRTDHRLKP